MSESRDANEDRYGPAMGRFGGGGGGFRGRGRQEGHDTQYTNTSRQLHNTGTAGLESKWSAPKFSSSAAEARPCTRPRVPVSTLLYR